MVALTDVSGTTVASYAKDVFSTLTSTMETFANGWSNPYRYDGRDGVCYVPETWPVLDDGTHLRPALDPVLSRNPPGRAPLKWSSQPYIYAGNNPLVNVDPCIVYRH